MRLAMLVALIIAASPRPGAAEALFAAGLEFSDELGGFRLLVASGSGSLGDPIVIVEEVTGPQAPTLVIRRADEFWRRALPVRDQPTLSIAVIKITINRTGRIWHAYDLELRERLHAESIYGDGLSFDQSATFRRVPLSDRFARVAPRDEPADRLSFSGGLVPVGAAARFDFYITDPTPTAEFYLLQHPRIEIAGRTDLTGPALPTGRPMAY